MKEVYNPFIFVVNSLLPEPHASLLAGMLFGIKTTMPWDLYNGLVTTGTLHVVALSGINISILINLVARITIFLGRKASGMLTVCLIVLFVLFVGPSPSIVRAALMGSFSLVAVYFGRQSWGLLSLVLVAGIMLLFNFSLIFDISFQLSFLATLGIILANKYIKCQISKGLSEQFKCFLKLNLGITLSAQLFTLPIIFYNFHRISLISPLANLSIAWLIQPIMIVGLLAAILGWIWLPLGYIPAMITWVPLTTFIKLIEIFARIPGASVQF